MAFNCFSQASADASVGDSFIVSGCTPGIGLSVSSYTEDTIIWIDNIRKTKLRRFEE